MPKIVPVAILPALLLIAAILLAACGDKTSADRERPAAGESGLPTPQTTTGSVTGMPDAPGPGQNQAPANLELPPDMPIASDGTPGVPSLDGNPETGMAMPGSPGNGELLTPEGLPRGEPGPGDAVDTLREYYANINSRSYGRAYVLWSGSGSGSGQSPQQFADGFASTTGVSIEIRQPGAMGAAAGSRYINVPVVIVASQRDGSLRKYAGAYTLRYSVVDGATPEQRNWRIDSADLREVNP